FSISLLLSDYSPPQIYSLSLHDALPIFLSLKTEQEESSCTRTEGEAVIVRPLDGDRAAAVLNVERERLRVDGAVGSDGNRRIGGDRKSTRLNSSHGSISYAVFCLKKKRL